MSERWALKANSRITMPNGGRFVIDRLFGQGGLSLIYTAHTAQNNYPVIVKEFFPSKGAYRAAASKDGKKRGRVYADPGGEERFASCLAAFEREGKLGSSARSANFQIIAFSDCGDGYAILPRWSGDTRSFQELVAGWNEKPPASIDPVFTGLGRAHFALAATSSLLSALASVHAQGMLHLDISASNVAWSGSTESPTNGASFLTDFGCSALMEDGAVPAGYVLSYSPSYAAPEYKDRSGRFTPASDLYAVGRLLAFLCFGERAFSHSGCYDVGYLIRRMKLPDSVGVPLQELIGKAAAERPDDRFQSAEEMREEVDHLIELIPLRPVNPDVTKDFTLNSLRDMLLGHSDWAVGLRDRRGLYKEWTDAERDGPRLTDQKFNSDDNFLKQILPDAYYNCILEQVRKGNVSIPDILTGNYDRALKDKLVSMTAQYGAGELVNQAGAILEHHEMDFFKAYQTLGNILNGSDVNEKYFMDCQTRCESVRNPQIGMAMMILFALLGPEFFKRLNGGAPEKVKKFFMGK